MALLDMYDTLVPSSYTFDLGFWARGFRLRGWKNDANGVEVGYWGLLEAPIGMI